MITPGSNRSLCRLGLIVAALMIVSLGAQAAVRGTLRVSSFPPGAEVWIDGTFTGKTTPAILLIATGEHLVMAKAPDAGWAPAQKSVVVESGVNAVSLTLVPQGVQGPPGPPGPPGEVVPEYARVEVDCDAGEQILPALATPGVNLMVVVRGTCEESIKLHRANVTLWAGAPGAGLRTTSTEQNLLEVWAPGNVMLTNLTLQGGRAALSVHMGAVVGAQGLDISGAVNGVQMSNARGSFHECKIHDNVSDGFNQHMGASAYLQNSEVYNNGTGISMSGGEFSMWGVTVRDNSWVGLWAFGGSNIRVEQSSFTGNADHGLFLTGGSTATVGRSRVAANSGDGINLMDGSVVGLFEGAVVEDNAHNGISGTGSSSVMLNNGSLVQANHGNGVHLNDVAQLFINFNGMIQNNEAWGLYCSPEPALARVHGDFVFEPSRIGPNGLGRISCPGLTVP